MNNLNVNGLHYHNSLKTSGPGFNIYQPNTEIISEPLTNKYSVGEQIGRGKFAVVKKCTNHETKEVVAAKLIKKRRRGKTCRDEILREVVMLEMALDHPRLVNLKEVYETQSELILITEYCAGGELFTECILDEKFKECDVRLLMSQILEGLTYLHEKSIVHLDLKPQNILLTEPFPKGTVKICDLGFACLVNTGEDIRDIIGTPDYVAPEVLNYDPLGLYTDMWSLGVLTYVMLTQCSPFAGDDKQQTFCNITTVQLDFPEDLFSDVSSAAQDFIKKLLIANPDERMTARECLQHPWVSGSPSSTTSLSTEEEKSASESHIQNSMLDHSMLENQNLTKNLTDSSDNLSTSSQEVTQNSNMVTSDSNILTSDSNMVTSDSKSSVSSSILDSTCGENKTDRNNTIELTSDKESVVLEMENSENLNQIEGSEVLNQRKDFEIQNPSETEVDMDTKSETQSIMDISFTKDDIERNTFEKIEESKYENEFSFEQNNSYFVNQDTEMRNRSMSETESIVIEKLNNSNLENVLKSSSSVEIVVEDNTVLDALDQHVSPQVIEIDLQGGSDSGSVTPQESLSRVANSSSSGSDNTLCDSSSTSNIKINENPYKRGMCNDSSPSAMATTNSNQSEDEIQYEFISVSKRVRNYEQTLSPQKSPQISPKSPRSPRVRRLQAKISHLNTPKSS